VKSSRFPPLTAPRRVIEHHRESVTDGEIILEDCAVVVIARSRNSVVICWYWLWSVATMGQLIARHAVLDAQQQEVHVEVVGVFVRFVATTRPPTII
jgi:hypothetical protein